MKHDDTFKIVKELEFDTNKVICKEGDVELYIFRPSKLSARFKDYDVKKNFQIWLKEGERTFRPNHLRVMIDLNLRIRSKPDLKMKLLEIFDNIFYGKDPDEEIKKLAGERFEHYLNSLRIIANLFQLFVIEQEYGYHKPSRFEPPTLFLHGWIREFIDSPKEIDNMCMSVCSGQPPKAQYTDKENKKNKRYEEKRTSLWYLEK